MRIRSFYIKILSAIMIRNIVLIISLSFIVNFNTYSQVYPLLPKFYQPIDSSVVAEYNKEEVKEPTLMKRHQKVSYSVNLGTAYNNFGNDISMMNSYIAPSISYWANSKLNFTVTGILMQNSMSGMEEFYGMEPGYSVNSNMSNYGVTGSAYYQLSEKWSIWGDGMYFEDRSVFDNSESDFYNTDFKSVSIGVGYKVNDTFHFNLQCRIVDGLNPVYNHTSPFYSSGFSPFRSNYGIWGY